MRLPRELDAVEVRVLGALLEKEQTTPDYYPLTLNALTAACNQRSNRSPVMSLSEEDVHNALVRLHEDVLVWPTQSARVQRWRQNLDRRWQLEAPTKAVMTLLMLRGPQTPGELRGRSERMCHFASPAEVEAVLQQLRDHEEPLVVQLTRRPGQTEARWMHVVAGTPDEEELLQEQETPLAVSYDRGLQERVAGLERRVEILERELAELKALLE